MQKVVGQGSILIWGSTASPSPPRMLFCVLFVNYLPIVFFCLEPMVAMAEEMAHIDADMVLQM
jgi:hypothetical protein